MSTNKVQAGASFVFALLILLLVAGALAASAVLTRWTEKESDVSALKARMERASAALDSFAATAERLPCPADPGSDEGLEVPLVSNDAKCSFPRGTLPWRSIGLRVQDSLDSWGRKISYRVYTGSSSSGSLTQPRGISMVKCDSDEAFSTGPTSVGTGLTEGKGGVCKPDPEPIPLDLYARSTSPGDFYSGKTLTLNEMGVSRDRVAYVLVSHGASGFGAFSSSGIALPAPNSNSEKFNAAEGPFTIQAFSGSDVAATSGQHFDDFLVYRTLPDLVKIAGLEARNWPDPWGLFDHSVIGGAIGRAVEAGEGIGSSVLNLPGVTIAAEDSGGGSPEIIYDEVNGVGGIGVENGLNSHLESNADESLKIDFGKAGQKFAVTLNHFGGYFTPSDDSPFFFELYVERVLFDFYDGANFKTTVLQQGCALDGGLASFSMDVGTQFNRVVIRPAPAVNAVPPPPLGVTTFLVSEVRSCAAFETCVTTLSLPPNTPNSCS